MKNRERFTMNDSNFCSRGNDKEFVILKSKET